MPRKLIDFELDFMIKDIFPRFTVKQFDDVSFNIKPKKQGLDYDTTGMTGKIFIGVNNDMFMQTKNITVSNNNVNILLDRNMLQKNGRAYAEVELTDSNGTITSSSFIFNIDAKIGEGAKIPGEYEGFVAKYERLISEFKAQVNSTIDNCKTNINSTINNCNKAVDNKLNDVDNFIDNKILDIEKRFNTLTSSQQQESEVIDARDGEVSLKARLDRDMGRIEAIEGLKDSQNMKYETDKGYLVCKETKNGVIDDLKIEGKTLVNVLRLGGNWFEQETTLQTDSTNNIGLSDYRNSLDLSLLKNNTVYTVIPFVDYTVIKKGMIYVQLNTEINGTLQGLFRITEDMFNKPTLITTSELTNKNNRSLFIGGANCEYKFKNVKILVLEGDHTQNPPSFFEGLMSVGQDVDKIEVLSSNNLLEEDENYKQDKKQILFYNENGELEPIQELHEWDSIEKHSDNKWYYHKRSGKVVLNGSENWLDNGGTTNTKRCQLDVSSWKCKNTNDYGKSIVCDKFRVLDGGHYDSDVEHFYIDFSRNYLYIFPLLSKLPTQDLQGFKQWLQANNVTVVYQLAQEEVYEIAP